MDLNDAELTERTKNPEEQWAKEIKNANKKSDKKWSVVAFIVLFVVALVVTYQYFSSDSPNPSSAAEVSNKDAGLISTNFSKFYSDNQKLTEIQQKSKWEEIKGKKVRWSGYIHDIFIGADNKTYMAVAVEGVSYFTAQLSDGQKIDPAKMNKGDQIEIQGELLEPGSLLKSWIISNAEITSYKSTSNH